MKFKIICPDKISGCKGEKITLYKNTKGLYVAILRGVEVGIVKGVESEKEPILMPCMEGIIEKNFSEKFCFSAKGI